MCHNELRPGGQCMQICIFLISRHFAFRISQEDQQEGMRNSKSKSKQQTGRRGGGGRGIGSTTNPKRRKTRSTSKKESFSTAEHLASATVVLTENGWLPSPAARTLCALELTCRSTSSIRLKDEAWKALCCNIWPSTGEINSNYIHQSFGGYKVGGYISLL